jgi:putative transposase
MCTNEKAGIQALERLCPTKPVRPRQPERREFEYIRHGTRCLLASFVVPTGSVYGDVTARRANRDHRRHIRNTVAWLGEQYPHVGRSHWVTGNRNTHGSPAVCRLFARLSGVKLEPKVMRRGARRHAFLTEPKHRRVIHYTPQAWELAEPGGNLV